MRKLGLGLLGLLLGLGVYAQKGTRCELRGTAPEYAGQVISVSTPSDFISHTTRELSTDTVGADGSFRFTFPLLEPRILTLSLGAYTAYLYLAPGEHMQVGFPPRKDMTEAERLNPFYEPLEVQLRDKARDTSTINDRIARFDMEFERMGDSVLLRTARSDPQGLRQKAYEHLLGCQNPCYQPFVNEYIRYRAGLFAYLAKYMRAKQLSETFFQTEPVLYANPAYMTLFNLVYDRYFLLHGLTKKGREIHRAVSTERSLYKLNRVLDQNENLKQDSLREMVILKNLYDEFFSDKFSRKALQTILDSLYVRTTVPEHSDIANVIRERITRLLPGFIPHSFKLRDANGKLYTTQDFAGKLILLNFCATTSYTCLQDFALLKTMKEQFGEKLAIVCISTDRKVEDFQNFIGQTDFPFTFLHYGNQPELVKNYDIRAYPTYFLLDEEGRIILSPAPSPRENLAKRIYAQYQQRRWALPRVKAQGGHRQRGHRATRRPPAR